MVNLRSIDLNLLVLFDALMAERHVTRAANRVAISQPAMSNALGRMRAVFKDELFVRTAKGMEPTPRALELAQLIHPILQQAVRLMNSDSQFDPTGSERTFKTRMSDLLGIIILPKLMGHLRAEAPRVSLDVVHLSPEQTVEALETDQLDVAVSMDIEHTSTIRSEMLFADRMACIMRADHPLAHGRLTIKEFLSYGHLRVSMSPSDVRFVDRLLAAQNLERNVVLNVAHWSLVPRVLLETDLIAVMSARGAQHLAGSKVAIRALPFDASNFMWNLYWHRRYEHSRDRKSTRLNSSH